MFYVYFLKNRFDEIYIGCTSNLQKRVRGHNYGNTKFTKAKGPWKLVYSEAFLSEKDARLREKTLKNYGSSLGQLKKRVANSMEI